jgi:hypothetical protein
MRRKKRVRRIFLFVIVIALIIFGIQFYKKQALLNTMRNTIQEYFEKNNSHISSREFSIKNVKIVCKGNDAYLTEFSLFFDDEKKAAFNKLGAVVFKEKNEWKVKGFSSGFTTEELQEYNLKCKIKR